MPEAPTLERLLKRDRAITAAGLAALCVLAWLYLMAGAGLGMSAWQMTSATLFPHLTQTMPGMPGMQMSPATPPAWSAGAWALVIAMWWTMMIAMMAPSATPAILLFAAVYRHAIAQGRIEDKLAPTGAFVTGYLMAWLCFSIAATGAQWTLEQTGLVSAMAMGSQNRWLSAGVLLAAGIYQITPLKHHCLAHCRAPASFLSSHWRPHASGALRLGALHGAYCVGCCWMLMTLLFVGGVMNLAWIAALTALVLVEKALPAGQWVSRGAGIVLLAWGAATLLI